MMSPTTSASKDNRIILRERLKLWEKRPVGGVPCVRNRDLDEGLGELGPQPQPSQVMFVKQ